MVALRSVKPFSFYDLVNGTHWLPRSSSFLGLLHGDEHELLRGTGESSLFRR